MKFLAVLLITLAFGFSLNAQEHSKRPPQRAPRTTPSPTPATAEAGAAWTRFTSEAGRFSVLIPGTPQDKAETEQSEHGPYTTHLLMLKDTKNVFLIGWVDYPPTFNFNRQAEMEMNRDNFVKGVEATLLDTRPLTIDGYKAIEFTAETADKIFKSRVYMVGRRPYQIVIGSLKGEDDSVNVNRFFNSFKVSLN